jgi:hypothetical protein
MEQGLASGAGEAAVLVPLAPPGGAGAALHKTKGWMRRSSASTYGGSNDNALPGRSPRRKCTRGQAAQCLDLEDGGVRPEGERHHGSSGEGGAGMARSCGPSRTRGRRVDKEDPSRTIGCSGGPSWGGAPTKDQGDARARKQTSTTPTQV